MSKGGVEKEAAPVELLTRHWSLYRLRLVILLKHSSSGYLATNLVALRADYLSFDPFVRCSLSVYPLETKLALCIRA
jgi:hypothetical protein